MDKVQEAIKVLNMANAYGNLGDCICKAISLLKSEPEQTDEVILLYKEQLNRSDSNKSFFTYEEVQLLLEHTKHLREAFDRLSAENKQLKEAVNPNCELF